MEVLGLIKRAAEKTGFVRERTNDSQMPTDTSNITVVPFFGDMRSMVVLSSLLLKRFREEERGSKYFILASWPGYQGLFPYVDEYWGIQDEDCVAKFYEEATQFRNRHQLSSGFFRSLNQYFFEDVVIPADQFGPYYDLGITNEYWNKYKHIRRTLPGIPSSAVLGKEFNRELQGRGGMKVFIYPSLYARFWEAGINNLKVKKDFWVALVERLLKERFMPVIYKGLLTYDISPEFTNRCVYCTETDVGKVMTAMRATGCVLDVFSGISRLALMARCPFLSVDERNRYSALKEYEMDDLCGPTVPKQYIFSFPTILEGGVPETWDHTLFNNIVTRLNSFLPELDREGWPSTGESTEVVLYETVRKKKAKRIGTRLLKVPKD